MRVSVNSAITSSRLPNGSFARVLGFVEVSIGPEAGWQLYYDRECSLEELNTCLASARLNVNRYALLRRELCEGAKSLTR